MSSRKEEFVMTKKTAEYILHDQMTKKEFWIVDNEDNVKDLQAVLDRLFNSVEGNIYKADYVTNQSSSRLLIRCEVCAKDLLSYDPFMSHGAGKAHKKAVQQSLTKKDINLIGPIKRKDRTERKEMFTEGTLEEDLDLTKHRVVGLQFVYKVKSESSEEFDYYCQLCNVDKLSQKSMFNHIIDEDHGRHYLEVKFDMGDMKDNHEVEYELKKLEKLEGRINHKIPDFSKPFLRKRERSVSGSPPPIPPQCIEVADGPSSPDGTPPRPPRPASPPPIITTKDAQVQAKPIDICDVPFFYEDLQNIASSFSHQSATYHHEILDVMMNNRGYQEVLIQTLNVLSNKLAESYKEPSSVTKMQMEIDTKKREQMNQNMVSAWELAGDILNLNPVD